MSLKFISVTFKKLSCIKLRLLFVTSLFGEADVCTVCVVKQTQ